MRILMLTQWFDPEPTFKGLAFARELKRRGHEVEVLTGFPNYPGGKLYAGYRLRFLQRELIDGISVIRVPIYPSHDSSSVKRIFNYMSFAFSAALLGPLLVQRADIMYVYHPPATVALPAVVIKLLRGLPFVFDVQDLWPDTLGATGMLTNRIALKLVDRWCRFVYRQAARIVVLSPGFKQKLVERGISQHKIEVIYNWCDEEQLRTPSGGGSMPGSFNVVFAGTMGAAQALDAVLDAAILLREQCPAIKFVFVGGGIDVERLKKRSLQQAMSNVLFLPRCPMSEIGSILRHADVLLVHLKDDALFRITIPSKTQAYLAAGRPILMGVRGDAADMVERAEAGVVCSPEDPESIARGAVMLYSMPAEQRIALGENGRKFYDSQLSLAAGVDGFDRIFLAVAQGK